MKSIVKFVCINAFLLSNIMAAEDFGTHQVQHQNTYVTHAAAGAPPPPNPPREYFNRLRLEPIYQLLQTQELEGTRRLLTQVSEIQRLQTQALEFEPPQIQLPQIQLPQIQVAEIQLPVIQMPEIQMPELELHEIMPTDQQNAETLDDVPFSYER